MRRSIAHAARVLMTVVAMMAGPSCGASATVALVSSSLDDQPDAVSPTAAITIVLSAPVDAASVDDTSVLVVRGVADSGLVDRADKPPLDPAEIARLAAGALAVDGATITFTPTAPLEGTTLYTLVVSGRVTAGGVALPRPALRAFTTAPSSEGAAVFSLVDPLDGARLVIRNLRQVDVLASRSVSGVLDGDLILRGPLGDAPAHAVARDCEGCWSLVLDGLLEPGGRYALIAGPGIVDDSGAPPFAIATPPSFSVGDARRTHPPLLSAIDVLPSSGCLVARFETDVAAVASLCLDDDCVSERARLSHHELARPLAAGGAAQYTLGALDESTQPAAITPRAPVPASSPRQLTLTEVLTRPRGDSPAQQFVEVWNRGPAVESLGGLHLLDDSGADDELPEATLAPGGYALIVGSDWQPDDGFDPAPAPGTVIVTIARSHLGVRGLHVNGAELALDEADGRPVSRSSTMGLRPARGQSVRRVERCDVSGAWALSSDATSSPGAP